MRLFGWQRRPAVPNELVRKLHLPHDVDPNAAVGKDQPVAIGDVVETLRGIESELRQVRLQLDFVRTRVSCYVGDGVALTYMVDETPLFVNANDMGGPFNLLNGGRYEEENVDVLLSFVRDDTVFLDIGANVGLFTLKVGRRVGRNGKVYAFEPHPRLAELLHRNVYVNGLGETAACFQVGLSDQNTKATLQYPVGHLGGGHVDSRADVSGHAAIEADLRRLDDLFDQPFRCDLVKIDVEGHEIHVLRGMQRVVENSPSIKILFEKLLPNAGTEAALEDFFIASGLELYGVNADASLLKLEPGGLADWAGYALACRPHSLEGELIRARFAIYGGQLLTRSSTISAPGFMNAAVDQGEMLFHGPYWFLRQGVWRFRFHGRVQGSVRLFILERFGFPVLNFLLEEGQSEHVFVLHRDLLYFECAAYAASARAEVSLDRLEFIREG